MSLHCSLKWCACPHSSQWGKRENMPFIGPKKAAILQDLVRQKRPSFAVEVGSMAGYSAICIGRELRAGGAGGRLVSYEKDWGWGLAAKRFVWQALGKVRAPGRASPVEAAFGLTWHD